MIFGTERLARNVVSEPYKFFCLMPRLLNDGRVAWLHTIWGVKYKRKIGGLPNNSPTEEYEYFDNREDAGKFANDCAKSWEKPTGAPPPPGVSVPR